MATRLFIRLSLICRERGISLQIAFVVGENRFFPSASPTNLLNRRMAEILGRFELFFLQEIIDVHWKANNVDEEFRALQTIVDELQGQRSTVLLADFNADCS